MCKICRQLERPNTECREKERCGSLAICYRFIAFVIREHTYLFNLDRFFSFLNHVLSGKEHRRHYGIRILSTHRDTGHLCSFASLPLAKAGNNTSARPGKSNRRVDWEKQLLYSSKRSEFWNKRVAVEVGWWGGMFIRCLLSERMDAQHIPE